MTEDYNDTSEDILPDIPNVLSALEEQFQQLQEEEDFTKITKYDLAKNQEVILDSLMDIAKFVVAVNYKLDIMDKAVARAITLRETGEDMEDIDELTDEEKAAADRLNLLFS